MGILAKTEDGARGVELTSQFLVGSSTNCNLRIVGESISPHHAEIIWLGETWKVRDLSSSRGTYVNGASVSSKTHTLLGQGDSLGFGALRSSHRLIDAGPPKIFARNMNTGEILDLINGELILSAPRESPVRIIPGAEHSRWLICRGGRLAPIVDGDMIGVGSQVYTVYVPSETLAPRLPPTIDSVDLTLRVSQDEEVVEIWLRDSNDNVNIMPARAHYYTMLLLARMRLEDRSKDGLPLLEQGWRSVHQLCEMLAVEESRLNVDIYRIRRDIAKFGLLNSKDVIERQRSRRLVRLGIENVSICSM